MRNLYEAPLVELPENEDPAGEHHAGREYRNRTFVALAAYLLTGARQIGESPVFPETVPEGLAAYIRETLLHTTKHGSTPAPINELSSTLLLYTARTATMPVRIYSAVLDGEFGIAAALSTILLVSSGLCVYVVLRFSQSKESAFV